MPHHAPPGRGRAGRGRPGPLLATIALASALTLAPPLGGAPVTAATLPQTAKQGPAGGTAAAGLNALHPARGGGGSGGGSRSGGSSGGGSSSYHHDYDTSSSSGSSRSSSTTSSGSGSGSLPAWVWIMFAILLAGIVVRIGLSELRSKRRQENSAGAVSPEQVDMPAPQSLGTGFAEVGRARTIADLDQGLAEIRGHDPAFDLDAFRTAAQRTFFAVQQAWTARQPAITRQVKAESLWQAHKVQIDAQLAEGTSNRLDGLAVQNITIVGLNSDNGYDSAVVRFFASSADYTVDGTGRFLRGHTDIQVWTEDWIFQRSATATTHDHGGLLNARCPHCGAPLQLDTAGVCAYCRNTAVDGHDWVLTRIDQLPSWEWAIDAVPR